jgi:hypothetical protein
VKGYFVRIASEGIWDLQGVNPSDCRVYTLRNSSAKSWLIFLSFEIDYIIVYIVNQFYIRGSDGVQMSQNRSAAEFGFATGKMQPVTVLYVEINLHIR